MIKWHFGHRKIKPPGRAFFIGFLLFVITFISIFPTNIVTPESNNQNTFFFLLFLSCRLVYSLIHYNTRCIFSVCVCFSVYFVGTYACVFFLSSFLLVSAPYFRSYTFVGPAFLVYYVSVSRRILLLLLQIGWFRIDVGFFFFFLQRCCLLVIKCGN